MGMQKTIAALYDSVRFLLPPRGGRLLLHEECHVQQGDDDMFRWLLSPLRIWDICDDLVETELVVVMLL